MRFCQQIDGHLVARTVTVDPTRPELLLTEAWETLNGRRGVPDDLVCAHLDGALLSLQSRRTRGSPVAERAAAEAAAAGEMVDVMDPDDFQALQVLALSELRAGRPYILLTLRREEDAALVRALLRGRREPAD